MTRLNKISIFDSTLRDGSQAEGINFSVEDKLKIVRALDALGVSYIEAGNPSSNPKDIEFFVRVGALKLKNASLVAFGSTRRKDTRACDDPSLQALLSAGTSTVAVFGKCWDLHVGHILNTTNEENLNMIRDTVAYLTEKGRKVIFDAEHFFDGWKNNPEYALSALGAAAAGGAVTLALCDTNGGAFPEEIFRAVTAVRETFPSIEIGIHCHNDCGLAVANSLAAVNAGAAQVQGTFIGYGERCGNANLSALIAVLQLKKNYACIPAANMPELTAAAREIADISNIRLERYMPFVGSSAFTHKAGMHADGVIKLPRSFEQLDPALVGNERRFVMSEFAGRTATFNKIRKYFPELNKDGEEVKNILDRIKEQERAGYQYESAESSFMLEVYKSLGLYKPFFELISYKTIAEQPGEPNLSATATVKIRVQDKTHLLAAQGDGPVNALDLALRKCLGTFYPEISSMTLVDYKVRVLDGKAATAAVVRVLITTTDGRETWTTVGVSEDLIQASFKALSDSIEYRLLCNERKKKK
ncbi:MAG: citramalate synthase [Clostridiales bacterium]|jgi:2-isopropylmalate synthase|nr:citramalate synthase [Clostridiales bacterium]